MEKLKKLGTILLIVFFPLGIIFCILHSLGKSFITFLGSIFICAIGILIGIYIIQPELIHTWWNDFVNIFRVIFS